MTALLMVLAIQRLPGDEPIKVEKPLLAADATSVVVKQPDRIRQIELSAPVVASTESKPVVTERIVPDAPAATPPVIMVQDEDKPAPGYRRRHAERGGDVCARHNMKKVMVGKYRWRCRK